MGSWELDLSTGEIVWSAGMYRILDLPPAEERRTQADILEHIHPDDRALAEQMMTEVTERPDAVPEAGIEYRVRLVRDDGSVRELLTLGRLDRGGKGQPARWIGVAQDVTEQRLTERELRVHAAVSTALREWESFELGAVDLLRRIASPLDYPIAALWLWNASAETLACRGFWTAPDVDAGDFERVVRGARFQVGKGKPGLAWQSREPIVTPDVAADPGFVLRDAALERGITSAIAFPAVGPDGPVAVLSLYAFERRAPSAELVRTLTAIGDELGRFLDRRRAELGPRPLSEREIEVLLLAAEGLSGPAIAERLVLSPATVKTHFENIYAKLGVGDRASAVAHGLRTGLIA